jgi:hypothetical protein
MNRGLGPGIIKTFLDHLESSGFIDPRNDATKLSNVSAYGTN